MSTWEAMFLGLIQGLTEFLPVSSSGHLVIFQDILGLNESGVTLEVMLHCGTLLSVFVVFGKDFIRLFSFYKDKSQQHFILMLLVGTMVTAVLGLFLSGYAELLFKSTLLVGFMLLVTGGILILLTIIPVGEKTIPIMKINDAALIGLLQGLAVIPGISRSGSTILGSLFRGLDRENAIKYSFMLSAPAILGATILEIRELSAAGLDQAMAINYIAGGLVAFLAGIVAIRIFIRLLINHKFHYFAYYCWAVGTFVIVYSLITG